MAPKKGVVPPQFAKKTAAKGKPVAKGKPAAKAKGKGGKMPMVNGKPAWLAGK